MWAVRPRTRQSQTHQESRSTEELAARAVRDERRDVCLAYDGNSAAGVGGGLLNLAELDLSRSSGALTAVIGETGASDASEELVE